MMHTATIIEVELKKKNATTANKTYILVMEVVHHYRRRNFLMMMSHLTLARCAMFLVFIASF